MLTYEAITAQLVVPLMRLIGMVVLGLSIASMIEALNWTKTIARLATPLVRIGHLRSVSSASFALAFFSPPSANALLAESYDKKELSVLELILANLFNSSPTYLVHLPTLFSLVFAFLGKYAFIYVGLTLIASILRTVATMFIGRVFLKAPEYASEEIAKKENHEDSWQKKLKKIFRKFLSRLIKLLAFTIPCYIAIFYMQKQGWFSAAEHFLADHAQYLSFIRPEAFGIIMLYCVAESGAAFSAAASLLHGNSLSPHEIIMALLVGNIISSPMRAFRHQLPSYAGFFAPRLAFILVMANQTCRAASLLFVTVAYYWLVM